MVAGHTVVSRGDFASTLVLPIVAIAGIAITAGIVLVQFKAVVGDKERSYRGDVRTIVEILKRADKARVLVLPLCTAEIVAFFGDCRVLSTDSARVHAEDPDFRDFNPRLAKPLSYFLERYDITHVMAENTESFAGILNLPDGFVRTYHGSDYVLWIRTTPGAERQAGRNAP